MKSTATIARRSWYTLLACLLGGLLLPYLSQAQIRTPLPVELISFRARLTGSDVQLSWQTAQERDCNHFEVQESADGRAFVPLAAYPAHGSSTSVSSYGHVDKNAFLGAATTRYYRLKQVDNDGSTYYFPLVSVQGGGRRVKLTAWPVPATTELQVNFRAAQSQTIIRITDATGRTWAEQVARTEPNFSTTLPIAIAGLKQGVYVVQIKSVEGIEQFRFIKE